MPDIADDLRGVLSCNTCIVVSEHGLIALATRAKSFRSTGIACLRVRRRCFATRACGHCEFTSAPNFNLFEANCLRCRWLARVFLPNRLASILPISPVHRADNRFVTRDLDLLSLPAECFGPHKLSRPIFPQQRAALQGRFQCAPTLGYLLHESCRPRPAWDRESPTHITAQPLRPAQCHACADSVMPG